MREGEAKAREARRISLWGLAGNLALFGGKLVVGVVGHSQALVADAVHSLSDSVTDLAVYAGAPFWTAPPDAGHPHGHGRIETVVTFLIGLSLAAVGVFLGYRAIASLPSGHATAPGWPAFVAACTSMVIKEWLYRWTVRVGQRIGSAAVVANAWHHRSDALSSVPVAISVLGIRLFPGWGHLDHIATVIVSVLILHAGWQISWSAVRELADAGAAREERDQVLTMVKEIPGVCEVHALRTRFLGSGLQVDLHVLVDPELTVRAGHEIAESVERELRKKGPNILDVLVHIEPFEDGVKDRVAGAVVGSPGGAGSA